MRHVTQTPSKPAFDSTACPAKRRTFGISPRCTRKREPAGTSQTSGTFSSCMSPGNTCASSVVQQRARHRPERSPTLTGSMDEDQNRKRKEIWNSDSFHMKSHQGFWCAEIQCFPQRILKLKRLLTNIQALLKQSAALKEKVPLVFGGSKLGRKWTAKNKSLFLVILCLLIYIFFSALKPPSLHNDLNSPVLLDFRASVSWTCWCTRALRSPGVLPTGEERRGSVGRARLES